MKKELVVQKSPPTMPATLLEKAIERGVDIAQLKELMDLQERWDKKEAKKNFLEALSRFQTLVPVIRKNRMAKINSAKGNYSYKFADLGSIANSIKSPLEQCGLSYRWEFRENGNRLKVICLISHRDGHTETSEMEAGMDNSGYKNDIQQKGSTQTYLQRYTLIGGLGLSTADEDNDAKGHQTTFKEEQSEEEIIDQWKQVVSEKRSQIELQALYLKNKKAVDSNKPVQAIFKAREAELKGVHPEKIDMP